MSERIFGVVLLLLSAAGIWIGWDLKAPISYEPVGPRAFPILVLALIAVCAVPLVFTRREATDWAPSPVLVRVGVMFVVLLAYAYFFERLGFMLSTALMTVPIARFFGGSWKQSVIGGVVMAVVLFVLFDKLLDVALPTGLWFKHLLG